MTWWTEEHKSCGWAMKKKRNSFNCTTSQESSPGRRRTCFLINHQDEHNLRGFTKAPVSIKSRQVRLQSTETCKKKTGRYLDWTEISLCQKRKMWRRKRCSHDRTLYLWYLVVALLWLGSVDLTLYWWFHRSQKQQGRRRLIHRFSQIPRTATHRSAAGL